MKLFVILRIIILGVLFWILHMKTYLQEEKKKEKLEDIWKKNYEESEGDDE